MTAKNIADSLLSIGCEELKNGFFSLTKKPMGNFRFFLNEGAFSVYLTFAEEEISNTIVDRVYIDKISNLKDFFLSYGKTCIIARMYETVN